MLRPPLLFLVLPLSLAAQSFVEPSHLDAVRKTFDDAFRPPRLRCEIRPVTPELNFNLRFQTGYSASIPLSQYSGTGHFWVALSQVTPEGGETRYLILMAHLPNVPAAIGARADGEISGTFVVGEGEYSVETLVEDERGRACYAHWTIQAKRGAAERALSLSVPPNTVRSLWPGDAAPSEPAANQPGAPLTVLLHAAPLTPGLSKLEAEDVARLAGSLSALMEQLQVPSVRLVIFNLSQRSVLFQDNDFRTSKLDSAIRALNETQFAVVSYRSLKDQRTPLSVLDNLVRQEEAKTPAPRALIFLGPYAPALGKVALEPGIHPVLASDLFYVQYRPAHPSLFGNRGSNAAPAAAGRAGQTNAELSPAAVMPPADAPDAVERFVKLAKGDFVVARTPHDFAQAVGRILNRLHER